MKSYVLYHANCADGFGAAFAAWLGFARDAEFLPVSYYQPLPSIDDGSRVFILDFSYSRDVLIELNSRCQVTVLDHHKSAQKELDGLDFAKFDMEKSGAMMAWEYFHSGEPAPKLIQHIQDRDLWKYELDGTLEISKALANYPSDFKEWFTLIESEEQELTKLRAVGSALVSEMNRGIESALKRVVWIEIQGHKIPAVNTSCYFSEIGQALCEAYPDSPFSMFFSVGLDFEVQGGFRSIGNFDVSEVAKAFGGGGHKNAAGFRLPWGKFSKIVEMASTQKID